MRARTDRAADFRLDGPPPPHCWTSSLQEEVWSLQAVCLQRPHVLAHMDLACEQRLCLGGEGGSGPFPPAVAHRPLL